jgi:hypothetical protein
MTATSKYHTYPRVLRRFKSIYILAREKRDNMTHVSHEGTTGGLSSWQWSKSVVRSHLFLVHIFHMIPHTGLSVGGLYTIPVYIIAGEVRNHPTQRLLKLLSLWDPINPICVSTKSNLLIEARRSVFERHRQGLPPRSSESDIRPLSPFPSSILHIPLIGPARSHIEPQSNR